MSDTVKYVLDESRIPKAWYNIMADLPVPPPAVLHPSAVFYEQLQPSDDLEQAALAKYQYFVGELWERYGEDAWMGPWKSLRPPERRSA